MAKILIVEDEVIEAMALRELLLRLGHHVLPIVTKGSEVANVVETECPDLVLMDWYLADGTTGIEAARRIPAGSGTCVVFVTASDDAQVRAEASSLGYNVFLEKPYGDKQVRTAIEAASGGPV